MLHYLYMYNYSSYQCGNKHVNIVVKLFSIHCKFEQSVGQIYSHDYGADN